MARVFIGVPSYNGMISAGIVPGLFQITAKHTIHFTSVGTSLLANGFNKLWCTARQMNRFDYFVMIHADIQPDQDSLIKLLEIIKKTGADVVSGVSPIKNVHGLTSTAIGNPDDEWDPPRRLTMTEIHELPPTFDVNQAGHPGKILMINTGFMVVDLRKPWVREFPGFTIRDRIAVHQGQLVTQVLPEDWAFSRFLWEKGAKVLATREPVLHHFGMYPFTNANPWGSDTRDEEWFKSHGGAGDCEPVQVTAASEAAG